MKKMFYTRENYLDQGSLMDNSIDCENVSAYFSFAYWKSGHMGQ